MAAPATPQGFRVVTATVKDEHHVELTVACAPATGATQYRWPHMFGPDMNAPESRIIATTTLPTLTFGLTPPFTLSPGSSYTMGVEAGNADGWSVPNVQEFAIPAWVNPNGPAVGKPLAVVPFQVVNDSFMLTYPLVGPKGTHDVSFVLDTGAFEMLLTVADAAALGLPNLGPLQVAGVGGASSAYQSQVTLAVGPQTFANVPCVVDQTFAQNLFGARLLIDHSLAILVDPVASSVSFYGVG